MLGSAVEIAGLKQTKHITHYQTKYSFHLLLLSIPFADQEFQSRTLKSEGFADAVFQVSHIGEMHQLFVIYENNEGRRLYRYM